jgi:hypothetical protein
VHNVAARFKVRAIALSGVLAVGAEGRTSVAFA